jgi:carbon monoxide dehydrogenase subunit G
MPRLHEIVETTLPVDDAFAFVADFANSPAWDPNTVSSERLDAGPVAEGARYRLHVRQGSRVVPMTYRVATWEPGRRVVLEGEGSNVEARDEIRFEPTGTGTRIDYTADIRLTGWMRLVEPFAGGAFRRLATDAATGMRRALGERAKAGAR